MAVGIAGAVRTGGTRVAGATVLVQQVLHLWDVVAVPRLCCRTQWPPVRGTEQGPRQHLGSEPRLPQSHTCRHLAAFGAVGSTAQQQHPEHLHSPAMTQPHSPIPSSSCPVLCGAGLDRLARGSRAARRRRQPGGSSMVPWIAGSGSGCGGPGFKVWRRGGGSRAGA